MANKLNKIRENGKKKKGLKNGDDNTSARGCKKKKKRERAKEITKSANHL